MGKGDSMGISEIDKRGRITIPKEERELLGLKPGQKIYFFVENDALVIKKSIPKEQFKKEMRGCIIKPDKTFDPLTIKKIWEKNNHDTS